MTDVVDETVVETGPEALPQPDVAAQRVPYAARVLGTIGRFLITAGVVVFLFVGYELWGTNIREARSQSELRTELDERFAAAASLPDLGAGVIDAGATDDEPGVLPTPSSTLPGGHDPALLELFFPPDGEALAKIELPTLDVEKVVVRGIEVPDLRKGPGHYPSTALPGNAGNTSIAGHRTTYGAPFNRINELVPGDEVVVTGVQGEFTYQVVNPHLAFDGFGDDVDSFGDGHIIVSPGATWVLGDFGDNRLTLTACHPKLSSRQRIIVAAELVGEPATLPEWAEKAHADAVGDTNTTLGTDEAVDDESSDDESSGDDFVVVDGATADLDRGLSGERGAIPGAVAWMLAATVFWVGGRAVGRRFVGGRWGGLTGRLAGLVPALGCLWFGFEMIDRALPAG